MNATVVRSLITGSSRSMMKLLSRAFGRSKFWCTASAFAAVAVALPLLADGDFGFNSVGSLPNVADDGNLGAEAPVRIEPSLYVRGPASLFANDELVVDESGTGAAYDMIEERTGWQRREYRGDVYLAIDMRFLLTGEAEVGIAAGVRSDVRYMASVDGLQSGGATLPADMALRIPVGALAPRGVLESRFEVQTLATNLQEGLVRGNFTMQQSENLLKISQDQ